MFPEFLSQPLGDGRWSVGRRQTSSKARVIVLGAPYSGCACVCVCAHAGRSAQYRLRTRRLESVYEAVCYGWKTDFMFDMKRTQFFIRIRLHPVDAFPIPALCSSMCVCVCVYVEDIISYSVRSLHSWRATLEAESLLKRVFKKCF